MSYRRLLYVLNVLKTSQRLLYVVNVLKIFQKTSFIHCECPRELNVWMQDDALVWAVYLFKSKFTLYWVTTIFHLLRKIDFILVCMMISKTNNASLLLSLTTFFMVSFEKKFRISGFMFRRVCTMLCCCLVFLLFWKKS